MELSNSLCRPVDPDCTPCPLSRWCKYVDPTAGGLATRVHTPSESNDEAIAHEVDLTQNPHVSAG
jgi:adenine-specific DNA glycosylase